MTKNRSSYKSDASYIRLLEQGKKYPTIRDFNRENDQDLDRNMKHYLDKFVDE